jgi:hypothetical protein
MYNNNWKISWKIKYWFYEIVRPIFVSDIDRNEDYNCGYCCKPVLKRILYCSETCSSKHD